MLVKKAIVNNKSVNGAYCWAQFLLIAPTLEGVPNTCIGPHPFSSFILHLQTFSICYDVEYGVPSNWAGPSNGGRIYGW